MIAEVGHCLLWIALALALLQIIAGVAEVRGRAPIAPLRALAVGQGVLTLVAFACLIWLFMQSDMSVELVARNSHSAKPMLYYFSMLMPYLQRINAGRKYTLPEQPDFSY